MLYIIVDLDFRCRLILIKMKNKVLIQRIYMCKNNNYIFVYICSYYHHIYMVIIIILIIINVKIESDSKDLCIIINESYIILYQSYLIWIRCKYCKEYFIEVVDLINISL